jgi:hypothetical protein
MEGFIKINSPVGLFFPINSYYISMLCEHFLSFCILLYLQLQYKYICCTKKMFDNKLLINVSDNSLIFDSILLLFDVFFFFM